MWIPEMHELIQVYLFRRNEFVIVPDFVFSTHLEGLFRHNLAFDFDRSDCVCKSVLFGIVFGQYFLLCLLVLWIDVFFSLDFWRLLFFFFAFSLNFSDYILWISSERQGIELASKGLIELIKLWEGFKVELISGVVKGFVRESIMSLEINRNSDIVRRWSGKDFAPEKQLISIGNLYQSQQSHLQLDSTLIH